MNLNGGVYLVTGASSGIGRACAEGIAARGGRVALNGRDKTALETVLNELEGEGHRIYGADLSNPQDAEKTVRDVSADMGALNGLVHSAGISDMSLLRDAEYAKTEDMFRIHYLAFLALAKTACRRAYHAETMSIVVISSYAALEPEPGISAYAGVKAAVNASVQSLAQEYSRKKIRFNAVCPHHVDTPMMRKLSGILGKELYEERIKNEMSQGLISPEEVADAVLFLLSDESARISGAILPIRG
jgi:NAD(P)-dependent dehydrogenase (short-subunit alcohol dehydrogenase family)